MLNYPANVEMGRTMVLQALMYLEFLEAMREGYFHEDFRTSCSHLVEVVYFLDRSTQS